jgi:hypothetical protein
MWAYSHLRRAISQVAIIGVIVVILAVAGVGAYLAFSGGNNGTTTSTPGNTTTSTGNVQAPSVTGDLNAYLTDFNSRNVAGVVGYYVSTGTSTWKGQSGGTSGNYTGTDQINIAFSSTIGHATSQHATTTNLQITNTSSSTSVASYTLAISGSSAAIGPFNATVNVSQHWAYESGKWQIQSDVWNYLSFTSSNPTEATVFPQWGLQLEGKSPTLAGEHMLEWNVAPYIAAAAYGAVLALAAILAITLLRRRTK